MCVFRLEENENAARNEERGTGQEEVDEDNKISRKTNRVEDALKESPDHEEKNEFT